MGAANLENPPPMDDQETPVKRDRHRIEIKVSEAQKDLITRGALASRQGISEFVRGAAERAAEAILKGS
jgi:uncharacterized protein (DUF1778 family)